MWTLEDQDHAGGGGPSWRLAATGNTFQDAYQSIPRALENGVTSVRVGGDHLSSKWQPEMKKKQTDRPHRQLHPGADLRGSWQPLSEVRCPMKILLERAVTAGLLQMEIMAAQSAKVTRSPLQQTERVACLVGPSHGSLPTSLPPVAGRVTEHLPQMRPLPSRFESCFLIGSSLRLCVYIQPIRAHLALYNRLFKGFSQFR